MVVAVSPPVPRDQFETLVRPQTARLFRAAYRLTGNRSDAEDLVQDTFARACECLDEIAGCQRPDQWLLRVLYHRFIDTARRRRRSPVGTLDDSAESPAFASQDPGPEQLAERAESEATFHRAWLRLESDQRAVLSLRAEGYGMAEIEAITGIGREVLGARLHRARRSLRRHLEADTIRDAPAAIIRSKR
jgi:RNA polymerase sigma-70 factor (ECF subfamily)